MALQLPTHKKSNNFVYYSKHNPFRVSGKSGIKTYKQTSHLQ
jgi:hypothetical protein